MSFQKHWRVSAATVALCVGSLAGAQTSYNFTVDPTTSTLAGTMRANLGVNGSFIGSFDPVANPTGTQTKPGRHGTIGATENDPVSAWGSVRLKGNVDAPVSGTFTFIVNTSNNTLQISNYTVTATPSSSTTLNVGGMLCSRSFQTLQPTYTYRELNEQVPLGTASFDSVTLAQTADPATGVIHPTKGGAYRFRASFTTTLYLAVTLNGQSGTLSETVPVSLEGTLKPNSSGGAQLSAELSPRADWTALTSPIALPTFPFQLPAGSSATGNFLASLNLASFGLDLGHSTTLNASTN